MKSKEFIRNNRVECGLSKYNTWFDLQFQTYTYDDDSQWGIGINISKFYFYLRTKFKNRKVKTDWCQFDRRYGFSLTNAGSISFNEGLPDSLFIYKNRKSKIFNMPWNTHWVRTSYLQKDGSWIHFDKNTPDRYNKNESNSWTKTYPYTYVLKNGTVQNREAKVTVEEREWRMNWLRWIPFIKIVHKSIDVEFNDEVGEGSGSWKGGTIGCGWTMKKGETPLECLRRMEKERKF